MKPRVEKAGGIWWVNWFEEHQGLTVQRARPYDRWADALGWANYLAVTP